MTLTAVEADIPSEDDDIKLADPEPFSDVPSDKSLICESCDREFIHDKRGRKPKRCEDCRATNKTSAASSGNPRNSAARANLQAQIEGVYGMVALAVGMRDKTDASLIADAGPSLAKGWADWASVNPKVKKMLEGMITTTAAGAVIGGHAMLAMKIAANHRAKAAAMADANGSA